MPQFAMILAFGVLLAVAPGCGAPKRIVKKVLKTEEAIERTAEGHPGQVLPVLLVILNATQDYAVVHQDGTSVVAEVREIPGLGVSLPRSKDKIASLISHHLPFERILEGLSVATTPQSAKVIIEFEGA